MGERIQLPRRDDPANAAQSETAQPQTGHGPQTGHPTQTGRWPVRWWHRTAGAAAIVAVLVVGNATAADAAATPRRPSKAEIATAGAARSDGPVHGEFPVVAADGAAQTRRWQWGVVVAVDSTGFTVASDDGFSSDYRWSAAEMTNISVGDLVTVVGAVGNPAVVEGG